MKDHIAPNAASAINTDFGPRSLTRVGRTSMPAAAPKYIPEVVRETDLERSCGGTHWARTVWMEGKMKPWATPTNSRAMTRSVIRLGSRGTKAQVKDQRTNERRRTRLPPIFWAAQPPGTWEHAYP
ncbi:mediator of RNA polymerase II transcription subunit [Striga asiatica]|uniref:Mediator of RNA polymerase II transcription subunit n=1 Tax=Striga asiatica TaxID=4170 RepID=A0A5A7PRN7_STRAF|nr:mediator of RNA polymerase II transcription subunit [Striga asiatica]